MIVNVRNGDALPFLEPDDIVEVPCSVSAQGLVPGGGSAPLPRSARALVEAVKEYERGLVTAALTGDATAAAVAFAQHPLVPGSTAARELLADYIDLHGEHLAYLAPASAR